MCVRVHRVVDLAKDALLRLCEMPAERRTWFRQPSRVHAHGFGLRADCYCFCRKTLTSPAVNVSTAPIPSATFGASLAGAIVKSKLVMTAPAV